MPALIVSADGFEDSELLVPLYRLREEGVAVVVAAIERGTIVGKHGYQVEATQATDEIDPGNYDLLVLPGGEAPEALRHDTSALAIARAFVTEGKPVAAICHGPQVLAAAGVVRGRRMTGHRGLAKVLGEAGAHYQDEEVVVDDNLVTSRRPSDLPAFMRETMKKLHAQRRRVLA